MRRFLIRALVAVGVLAAIAVLDLTPRAAAGYLTVAAPAASASLGADDDPADSHNPSPVAHRLTPKFGLPVASPQQSGGMSSTSTGSSGADGPTSGTVSQVEPPIDGMTVYYREPDISFDLSRFIDSILDPPRGL